MLNFGHNQHKEPISHTGFILINVFIAHSVHRERERHIVHVWRVLCDSLQMHARSILSCSQCFGEDQELLPFVAHAFCALWSDQGFRAAAARGYEFELNDSAL